MCARVWKYETLFVKIKLLYVCEATSIRKIFDNIHYMWKTENISIHTMRLIFGKFAPEKLNLIKIQNHGITRYNYHLLPLSQKNVHQHKMFNL